MENEIASRIKTLREIAEKGADEVARALNVPTETYLQFESGEVDVPMGSLLELSRFYHVEMTDLLAGGGPMLHTFTFVKQGHGISVERVHQYEYRHLAYNFANRKAEPFLVTVESHPGDAMHMNSHEGQEFNYCVEGRLMIVIDGQEIVMEPGDSLYFDSQHPHGMRALDGKAAKFIAIIF